MRAKLQLSRNRRVKKMEGDVDNLFSSERKRHQLICQIQAFLAEGCSYREIAKRMGIGRNTIAKYRKGDPEKLCRFGSKQNPHACSLGTTINETVQSVGYCIYFCSYLY